MGIRSRLVSASIAVAMLAATLPIGVPVASAGTGPVAVKIAVAAPLTAGATVIGAGMDRGARVAVASFADELASVGVTVTVVDADDQGDPRTAVTEANALVADSAILGVVGHLNSGCSIPASRVYASVGLAMVTPESTNPALTQQGLNNVFRTCGTDAGQGTFGADIACKNLRLSSAFVVDDSTPYGSGLADGFAQRFKADGGRVVGRAKTTDKDTDFYALVALIKRKHPQVVYYGGIYNAGALFAAQLRRGGVTAQIVGADGLYDPHFIGLAGSSRANGTLATSVGLPTDQLPGGAAYEASSALLFPGQEVVTADDPYAYDAAAAILRGIIAVVREAGTPSVLLSPGAQDLVRAKVAASDFAGVTGTIRFNSRGDITAPRFMATRVVNGVWRDCAQIAVTSAPASVRANQAITIAGTLIPHHEPNPGSKRVTVYFERKIGGVWTRAKKLGVRVTDLRWYSAFKLTVKLPTKGQWRVYAEHSDARHGLMDSAPRYFKVTSALKVTAEGPLRTAYPKLPEPTARGASLADPASSGAVLQRLGSIAIGDNVISGLVRGKIPDGSYYRVVARPYGFGPSTKYGSRIVFRIDEAKPWGASPTLRLLANGKLLCLAASTHGGRILKGGRYSATVTFRRVGNVLFPIVSQASPA